MAKNNLVTVAAYQGSAEAQARTPPCALPVWLTFIKPMLPSVKMQRNGFDDLLLNTNILFRDHPDVLKNTNVFSVIFWLMSTRH